MKAPLELASETTSAKFHRNFSTQERQTLKRPAKSRVQIGVYEQQPYRTGNNGYGDFRFNQFATRDRILPKPNKLFHGSAKQTFDTTYSSQFPAKSCKRNDAIFFRGSII